MAKRRKINQVFLGRANTLTEYSQRVTDTILPISIGGSLPNAFDEWFFTEHTIDHEEPIEICQLCGQQDLRYHFQIQNKYTSSTLLVGSHCILKFNVAVMEKGRRLTSTEAKQRLSKLTQQMQLQSCVRALEKLAAKEDNQILSGALDYYRKKKKLTPKYAYVVFWKLHDFNVDHNPSFFKVELSRAKHIEDLKNMPTPRVHRFWSALSASQRKRAISLGHNAPDRHK